MKCLLGAVVFAQGFLSRMAFSKIQPSHDISHYIGHLTCLLSRIVGAAKCLLVGKILRAFQICQQIVCSCSSGWANGIFHGPTVRSHLQGHLLLTKLASFPPHLAFDLSHSPNFAARWPADFLSPSPSFAARWPPAYFLTQLCFQMTRAMFASVIHELCFACPWITLILDPTVWLDGARMVNTGILPTFTWMAPTHQVAYPGSKSWLREEGT